MIRALRAVGITFIRALRSTRRRPGYSALAISVIACALTVGVTVHLIARNFEAATQSWTERVDASIHLTRDTDAARGREIAAALTALPGVARARYVDRQQSLDRIRTTLGSDGALVDGVDPHLFPATVELGFAAGIAEVAASHPLATRLRAMPEVDSVEFAKLADLHAAKLRRVISRIGWVVFFALTLASLYIVGVALAIGRAQEHEEFSLLRGLGARASELRRSARWQGVGYGFFGAALALLAAYALFSFASSQLVGVVERPDIRFLTTFEAAIVGAAGVGIGWLASAASMRRQC